MLQETCNADFVVLGGGVAGTVAAIAAARQGLKTILIQNRPVLGGPSSSECSAEADGANVDGAPEYVNRCAMETGILEEMRREAFFRSANGWQCHWSLVLREWAEREPNLTLLLNTEAYGVLAQGQRIQALRARTLGAQRDYLIRAPLFADCSGDSFLAAEAGAEYRHGREAIDEFNESLAQPVPDRKTMGSSISFRAIDMGQPIPFKPPQWAYPIHSDEDIPYRLHNNPQKGYWWLEYGGELDTIHDNEAIYGKLLSILYGIWNHVKNDGDHGAANYAINWIAAIPGKRESRRVMGDYILTQNDLNSAKTFPDAVAFGGWPIDIHPPEGVFSKGHPGTTPPFVFPGVYPIPFRCLYSRNISNLMMAGRNISVTHVALGTTRVMATCALCGQAVGTAAAICRHHGCSPREAGRLHIRELQHLLYQTDQVLPWMTTDCEIQTAPCTVTASSQMCLNLDAPDAELPLVPADRDSTVYDPCNVPPNDRRRGQMFPLSTPRIDCVSILFNNHSDTPATVQAVLCQTLTPGVFNGPELGQATCVIPPGNKVTGAFDFNVNVDARSVFILLSQTPHVAACTQNRHLPAIYCKPDGCYASNDNICFRVTPEQRVFTPQMTITTPPRPALQPNLWISDPTQSLPQDITLNLDQPMICSAIELVFDTNLDKKRPQGPPPECIRNYRLETHDGSRWTLLLEINDNYQRVRRHTFAPRTIAACRLTALSTWGDASARLYNFRLMPAP